MDGDRVVQIVEKPKEPKSNWAVIGIYFYDSKVFDIVKTLKPSARNELEITDVNNAYIERGEMTADKVDRLLGRRRREHRLLPQGLQHGRPERREQGTAGCEVTPMSTVSTAAGGPLLAPATRNFPAVRGVARMNTGLAPSGTERARRLPPHPVFPRPRRPAVPEHRRGHLAPRRQVLGRLRGSGAARRAALFRDQRVPHHHPAASRGGRPRAGVTQEFLRPADAPHLPALLRGIGPVRRDGVGEGTSLARRPTVLPEPAVLRDLHDQLVRRLDGPRG